MKKIITSVITAYINVINCYMLSFIIIVINCYLSFIKYTNVLLIKLKIQVYYQILHVWTLHILISLIH